MEPNLSHLERLGGKPGLALQTLGGWRDGRIVRLDPHPAGPERLAPANMIRVRRIVRAIRTRSARSEPETTRVQTQAMGIGWGGRWDSNPQQLESQRRRRQDYIHKINYFRRTRTFKNAKKGELNAQNSHSPFDPAAAASVAVPLDQGNGTSWYEPASAPSTAVTTAAKAR